MSAIAVKHNIEVAHRLSQLPGKCENIHGHSMWVTLYIEGSVNRTGILAGIEFGALKNIFRSHLDAYYDHHLLLNAKDPWAQRLGPDHTPTDQLDTLPGLRVCPGDPTTENIAQWIHNEMADYMHLMPDGSAQIEFVEVWETSVNMARSANASK